jgi:hypothetical protein
VTRVLAVTTLSAVESDLDEHVVSEGLFSAGCTRSRCMDVIGLEQRKFCGTGDGGCEVSESRCRAEAEKASEHMALEFRS